MSHRSSIDELKICRSPTTPMPAAPLLSPALHFHLNPVEKLGLVGESGSGKSTMALAMMRMIKPPGRIEGGKVIVGGTDLRTLLDEEMLKARLSKIAYIPQGAMNSLNPVMRIGAQMVDAIKCAPSQNGEIRGNRTLPAVASVGRS